MQSVMQMFVARFASEGLRRTLLARYGLSHFNYQILAIPGTADACVEKGQATEAAYESSGSFDFVARKVR